VATLRTGDRGQWDRVSLGQVELGAGQQVALTVAEFALLDARLDNYGLEVGIEVAQASSECGELVKGSAFEPCSSALASPAFAAGHVFDEAATVAFPVNAALSLATDLV
jgi:hypothetical protein